MDENKEKIKNIIFSLFWETRVKNHWLDQIRYKSILEEIEEIFLEVWGENGSLAEFIDALNDEQADLFLNMRLSDGIVSHEDLEIGITLIKP